jgi:hypothetical protein
MALDLKSSHKSAFKDIFGLVGGKDNKIDKNGLDRLFKTIDY